MKQANEPTKRKIRAYMKKRGYPVIRISVRRDGVRVSFRKTRGPYGLSRVTYGQPAVDKMVAA